MSREAAASPVPTTTPTGLSPVEGLTPNGRTVLERRYLRRDAAGRPVEGPEDLFWRVASSVAQTERAHAAAGEDPAARVERYAREFYGMMARLDFLPNSPALMNAGRPLGQCFACFVLPVEDTILSERGDGIFDAVRAAAYIHKTGGGTGFSFSRLRPEGSLVRSSGGRASGPVSFMRVFNTATDAINQGGFRRGANMAVLRCDHPDILDFIDLKVDPGEMRNFNLSVGVTDDFLDAVREGKPHFVMDPHTRERRPLRAKLRDTEGRVTGHEERTWSSRDVFDRIVRRAWESGEPGLVFLDRINRFNPTPQLGPMEATNPCGEQPLLPWEACNLGSIHLGRFVVEGTAVTEPASRIDWPRLARQVALGVRFLDNVIDINAYPHPQIDFLVKSNRKVGLGIMGWADLLFRLEVPYDAPEAVTLAERVMGFIKEEAWKASMALAQERGPFPNFEGSLFTAGNVDHPYFAEAWRQACRRENRRVPIRNATVTTIAPTGTLSIVAGTTGGIEPAFSLAFQRQILDGEALLEVHPEFKRTAETRGFYSEELVRKVAAAGTLKHLPEVPDRWRRVFVSARDVSPEAHLRMQAAFQNHTDNAVSKTVNFANETTEVDVRRVYELAVDLGVKGVTVYRDGCRSGQPMARVVETAPAAGEPGAEKTPQPRPAKRPVPDEAQGIRYRVPTNLGDAYVTITEDVHGARELFTNLGKSGSDIQALSEALSRIISTSLGYGVPLESLAKQMLNITSQPVFHKDGVVKSLPDGIGQAMLRHLTRGQARGGALENHVRGVGTPTGALCPECGIPLVFEEGCNGGKCRGCGYANC
jgi:ribonucleoside-diphosphate reductase alpha chain